MSYLLSQDNVFSNNGRRTMPRVNVKGIPIECEWGKNLKERVPGEAVTLSSTGLSFSIPENKLEIKSRCRIILHPLYPQVPIPLEGVVAWKLPLENGVLYGFRITKINPDIFDFNSVIHSEDNRFSIPHTRRKNIDRRKESMAVEKPEEKRKRIDRRIAPAALASNHIDPFRVDRKERFSSTESEFEKKPKDLGIVDFPLSLGGVDVQTGKVEYFPYTEQLILNYEKTRKVISDCKSGKFVEDVAKYIYGKYSIGDSHQNIEAMRSAHAASRSFRNFSMARRHKILGDIHDLLVEKKNELIDLMVIEGHPIRLAEWEFMGMEVAFRPPTLEFFKNEMLKSIGCYDGESVYLTRKADGVVCVSPPKNAPASISLFAAFCLLPGNALIIKPPVRIPIACMYLWKEIVQRACKANGAPDGVINIITGHSETLMNEWLQSKFVNDIFFFGDSKMGLEIGAKAFQCGKKPILELSGNDFMVVWEDAPLKDAAESLLEGFLGSMQICMAPKKAIIHPSIFNKFLEIFAPMVQSQVKAGLPSNRDTFLTPVTRIREFEVALDRLAAQGGKCILGGNRLNYLGEVDGKGHFLEATLARIRDYDPMKYDCVAEENFFPLMPIISLPNDHSFSNEEIFYWTMDLINKNKYGLRTSVWTKSKIWASKFAEEIHNSGTLRINSPHLRFSPCLAPNGGVGRSGGPFGEMNFPWLKSSHLQGVSVRW